MTTAPAVEWSSERAHDTDGTSQVVHTPGSAKLTEQSWEIQIFLLKIPLGVI